MSSSLDGHHPTERTSPPICQLRSHRAVLTSHNRTVPSAEPVRSHSPLGETERE